MNRDALRAAVGVILLSIAFTGVVLVIFIGQRCH